MENYGKLWKTMGKPQENDGFMGFYGIFMGCYGIYPLVMTQLWKITIFNGKIQDLNGHVQQLCNKLPEGKL